MKTRKILSGDAMEKILTKKALPQWLIKLNAYQIYAPVKKENHWSYEALDKPESIRLDHLNTIQSPKMIIFPQREVFFEFHNAEGNTLVMKEPASESSATVIFGVRPCDAAGVTHQDKVFDGHFKDLYYWKRRNQTILVGLACNTPPSPHCFCLSVGGSPHSTAGFDILMTELEDSYYVESFSKKGDTLISLAGDIFSTPKENDKKDKEKAHSDSEKKLKRHIKDLETVPPKLKDMFDSPLWEEESLSCIQCGICTYLCPTCHCFDINDEKDSSSPLSGKRVRTWDNCQFPDFTMHSSGHNPRPDRASRLRQRIMHKFNYFVTNYKAYQCTGCGRCIDKCPVGIDIIEVLEKVRDYGK
jgi:ferredoxin